VIKKGKVQIINSVSDLTIDLILSLI